MAAPTEIVRAPGIKTIIKIVKLKSKKDQKVSKGTLLCMFKTDDDDTLKKLKSTTTGTVKEVFVKEGEECLAGHPLLSIETLKCSHPTVMKDMCADCGADLRLEHSTAGNRKEDVSASVAMVHSIPELIVSEELAKELGKADEERLLKTRKLVLLVDLDQTLIHTTNDNIPPNLKDVHHFQLWHGNQLLWYHTHLRPGTQQFLEKISKLYELHICTFGVRMYAHIIAKILDPDGKYFSHRILSRDECFSAASKTANLKALFPCGDSMVCIIDDREDVWSHVPNLIHVKPYRFFQGTADINAPPGLSKTEEDDKPIVHRVRTVSQSSTDSQKDQTEEKKDSACENKDTGQEKDTVQQPEKKDNEITEEQKEGKIGEEKIDENKEKSGIEAGMDDAEKGTADTVVKGNNDTDVKGNDNVEECTEMEIDHVEGVETESSKTKDTAEEKMERGAGDTGEITAPKDPDKTPQEKDIDQTADEKMEDDNHDIKENIEPKESDKSRAEINQRQSDTKEESGNEGMKNTEKDTEMKGTEESTKENDSEENEQEELIEWDDDDDYLLHLEDILQKIHSAFFSMHDQLKERGDQSKGKDSEESSAKEKPNLKNIVPYIKKKVLKGCNVVFSGVIPTNMAAEKSRAYIVAKALGANIQENVIPKKIDPENGTTHLIAAKLGTNKVRSAMKHKDIRIVDVSWLWSCSERWEKVEEALFPLVKDMSGTPLSDSPNPDTISNRDARKRKKENSDSEGKSKRRKEDSDNSSKELGDKTLEMEKTKECVQDEFEDDIFESNLGGQGEFQENPLSEGLKEKKFSLSYNPIYAFSDDDIAYMDKEVDDIMDEDDEIDPSSEEDEARNDRMRKAVLKSGGQDLESSSDESLTGETPRGWGLKRMLSPKSSSSEEDISSRVSLQQTEDQESDSENVMKKYEDIMTAFAPETESDEEFNESIGSVDDEIADAVEKEFLS